MNAFHEATFPLALALGAVGGPERRTEIVTLASGKETRNSPWAHSRRAWDVGVAVRKRSDIAALIAFFEARRGPLHAFRFRDPFDHDSAAPGAGVTPLDQPLGTGDGSAATFSLIKRYGDGAGGVDRPILKPIADSVRVAVDGVETSAFNVDATTGGVTFDAPPVRGAVLTAGFSFDTPARFGADRLEVSLETALAAGAPSVPIVEVRL